MRAFGRMMMCMTQPRTLDRILNAGVKIGGAQDRASAVPNLSRPNDVMNHSQSTLCDTCTPHLPHGALTIAGILVIVMWAAFLQRASGIHRGFEGEFRVSHPSLITMTLHSVPPFRALHTCYTII